MKRIILLLILIVLLAVGWYAYKAYTGKVPSLTEVKSDEKIDAISLILAFFVKNLSWPEELRKEKRTQTNKRTLIFIIFISFQ